MYLQSQLGKLCSDDGNLAVDDIETCKTASAKLNKNFEASENSEFWPNGCYLIDHGSVFFNDHSTGEKNNRAKQICKPTDKG